MSITITYVYIMSDWIQLQEPWCTQIMDLLDTAL